MPPARPDPSGPWPPEAGVPSNKVGLTVGLCVSFCWLPLCFPSSFINSLSAHPSLVGDWTNRKLSTLSWIKDRAWLITQPWAGVWVCWLPARASLLCGLSQPGPHLSFSSGPRSEPAVSKAPVGSGRMDVIHWDEALPPGAARLLPRPAVPGGLWTRSGP